MAFRKMAASILKQIGTWDCFRPENVSSLQSAPALNGTGQRGFNCKHLRWRLPTSWPLGKMREPAALELERPDGLRQKRADVDSIGWVWYRVTGNQRCTSRANDLVGIVREEAMNRQGDRRLSALQF